VRGWRVERGWRDELLPFHRSRKYVHVLYTAHGDRAKRRKRARTQLIRHLTAERPHRKLINYTPPTCAPAASQLNAACDNATCVPLLAHVCKAEPPHAEVGERHRHVLTHTHMPESEKAHWTHSLGG
jgi:hypothetical protein